MLIIPVPRGFVNNNTSPGLAPLFCIRSSFKTSPVTTNPYLGSLSSILCPPTIEIPASLALSAPPCKICETISLGKSFTGKPSIFNANNGLPPIA